MSRKLIAATLFLLKAIALFGAEGFVRYHLIAAFPDYADVLDRCLAFIAVVVFMYWGIPPFLRVSAPDLMPNGRD